MATASLTDRFGLIGPARQETIAGALPYFQPGGLLPVLRGAPGALARAF